MTHPIDIAALKHRHPIRSVFARFQSPAPDADGRKFHSPFRADRNPGCWIYQERFYDNQEAERGLDSIAVWAKFRGISNGEALREMAGPAPVAQPYRASIRLAHTKVKPEPWKFTDADYQTIRDNCKRFYESPLAEQWAHERSWNVETLRNCILDAELGLTAAGHIAFHYRHGIKERWEERGQRRFRWSLGGPCGDVWRGCHVADASVILLTEGETDAITLLNAGLEIPGQTAVAALASSSTLPSPEQFIGKHIRFFPDRDDAGGKAIEKLRHHILPATTLEIVQWNR